ncbi:MauE/DoxX family redox-associated membrane protein [Pedobacter hiemivivus]|uniref:Methylamine utilisation protein MauE domain-containing protein n=1 Tax=Pedobacter hiemivivus TaxID=2530454 RepID=A0A4R0NFF3_9SPHI|nr:MauE/DoxX family redox-associated membrane protein [Pedobacter hiemivivus]TCC98467.1 hypothetical protein EZ444_04065 [Pedobacter hiemivivus]
MNTKRIPQDNQPYGLFKLSLYSLFKEERNKKLFFDLVSYLFVLLFVYTAASKLQSLENFQLVLIKYPLLGKYNVLISYLVPAVELLIAFALIIEKYKRTGMIAALLLMICFTIYILYMFISGSNLPCSCGGLVSKLSWWHHVVFNLLMTGLAIWSLRVYRK